MTNKELQEIRKITLENEILKLEGNFNKKENINFINDSSIKNDDIIVINKDQDSNILFKYGHFFVKLDGFDMYAVLYRDLKTTEYFYRTAYYTYKKVYEIYIKRFSDEKRFESKHDEFNELREYFFEQILNKPQAEVVSEMPNNNKQLVKGRKNEPLF